MISSGKTKGTKQGHLTAHSAPPLFKDTELSFERHQLLSCLLVYSKTLKWKWVV